MPSHTPLRIAFAFDRQSDWLAKGFKPNQCQEFQTDEAIELMAAGLRELGTVEMVAGIRDLTKRLVAGEHANWDVVFNMCEGYGSLGREGQVPALLEAWGVPFTFSDSATMAVCQDKSKTKMIVQHYGVPTAPFACIPPLAQRASLELSPLDFIRRSPHAVALQNYPLFVKPATVSSGLGISQRNKVFNDEELVKIIEALSAEFPTSTLIVETFLPGTEYTVGIIGSGTQARVIGIEEFVFLKGKVDAPIDESLPYDSRDPGLFALDVYGYELKAQWSPNPQRFKIELDTEMGKGLSKVALDAWRVIGCSDGGRIDLRCDVNGDANFVEVNPIPGMEPRWSDLPVLAKNNGISFSELCKQIIDSALTNHKVHKY